MVGSLTSSPMQQLTIGNAMQCIYYLILPNLNQVVWLVPWHHHQCNVSSLFDLFSPSPLVWLVTIIILTTVIILTIVITIRLILIVTASNLFTYGDSCLVDIIIIILFTNMLDECWINVEQTSDD